MTHDTKDSNKVSATTLYRAECISGYTDEVSPLFNSEDEAYDWLEKVSCRMDPRIKSCENCQAEWMVIDYKDEADAASKLEQVSIEREEE